MTEDAGEGINMTSRAGDFTEKEWHDYSENVALEVGERRGRGPWEADSAEERHGEESAGDPRRQRRPSDSPWEAGEGARPSPPPAPRGNWEGGSRLNHTQCGVSWHGWHAGFPSSEATERPGEKNNEISPVRAQGNPGPARCGLRGQCA